MNYENERQVLLDAIKKAHQNGLVYYMAGNLSIRTPDNNVLIKPSGRSYEEMTAEDLVLVDLDGNVLAGKHRPSSETPMHTMVYREIEHVQAIVHTHSEHALICAITNTEIPPFCNELLGFGGLIPLAEFAIPGTIEIGKNAVKALQGPPQVKAALLPNHGAIAIGETMAEAFMRAHVLEKMASVYIQAKSMAPVEALSSEQVENIIEHYSKKK